MDEFDDYVHSELQNIEALQGTCRTYDGTEGQTMNVPFFDQLAMNETNFSAGNIPVVDVNQRNVPIVQANHHLKTTIGNAYQTLFAYDVIAGHARQHALAIARFNDKLKLDALLAADAEFTVGNNNLITASSGFLVKHLTDADYKLIDNGCTDSMISAYVSAKNMPSFTNDPDFKSWDQNSERPLMDGPRRSRMYNGVDMRVLGSASPANTLAPGGTVNSNVYVVGYESMAVAYNRRPKSIVVSEEHEDRITVLSSATAGASVLLPEGIVKIDTTIDIPN
jgi:hypothetical protein